MGAGKSGSTHRVACLDGLRGLAALWVLIGHAMILSGFTVPVISKPALAVDLFILISGFLMTFHYQERRAKEPWTNGATWMRFWVRRFFRIAPLYYVILGLAILAGPTIGQWRAEISVLVPISATAQDRYTDQSLANIAAHVSFVFGLLPDYGFRTALPDWSIGLEMQYYAVFPFLMLGVAAAGYLTIAAGLTLACLAAGFLFAPALAAFPEPSFLLLKLPIFLAGGLIAGALGRGPRERLGFCALALLLVLVPVGKFDGTGATLCRLTLCAGFAALVLYRHRPVLGAIERFLGNRFCHELGELSYGVYLIHLLVLVPILGLLATRYGAGLPTVLRFAVAAPATILIAYPLAWVAHVTIEKPGIAAGRFLLGLKSPARPLGNTSAPPDPAVAEHPLNN